MPARRGKTLLEMIVVISILAVVMVLGARLMVLLMRASDNSTQSLISTTTLFRLSRDFRRDVHAAIDVSVERSRGEIQNRLLLKLPKANEVVYVSEGKQLHRTLQRGKKTVRSERFQLSGSDSRFEWNAADRLVSFVYWPKGTKATDKSTKNRRSKEMRIEAILGRDHRFTAMSEAIDREEK